MTTASNADDGATVHVDIPAIAAARYDVVIAPGAFDTLATRVAAAAPAAAYAVIAPDDVARLHGEHILSVLRDAGLSAHLLTFAAGEASKTRQTWAALTDRMLELRLGRDCAVIALGGGVTGDLAGFIAATYMRGVPVVQLPTTLLAMIDASVGGKTGVDTLAGKNLVGAFHPPALVVIDPRVLQTLPIDEVRAGAAEAVKHGAILDEDYFEWLHRSAGAVLALEDEAVTRLVRRSVELKAAVVAEDPAERGLRAILNFGHTVGHALELHANYALRHGFAVAAGMIDEARIGELAGVTASGTRELVAAALGAFGIPSRAYHEGSGLIESMRLDKKARRTEPRFVLLERIGAVARAADGGWTHAVDRDVLLRALTVGSDV